jgi:hypothetical protein
MCRPVWQHFLSPHGFRSGFESGLEATLKIIRQPGMAPTLHLHCSSHNLPMKIMVRREKISSFTKPRPWFRLETDDYRAVYSHRQK